MVFETNYVGNSSIHILDLWDPDQAVLGTGPVEPRRRYFATIPNVTDIRYQESRGTGGYHSLQTTLTKRFSQGLSFMGNYTWSHSMAQGSGIFGPGAGHQDSRNLNADRGLSATDVRHRFIANWLYELPFGAGKRMASNASGVLQQIIGNWQFGGVVGIQSGSPLTVTGGAGRPNRSCDGNLPRGERTVDRWFDGKCFPIPDPLPDPVHGGVYIPYGNAGGMVIIGPGFANFDLSLFKRFDLDEHRRFEFRSEFFNAFNHTQFGNPQSGANSPLTGRILTARDARQIQIALKFIF